MDCLSISTIDMKFYYRHENVNTAIEVMQGDFDKYYQWCNFNTLTLNIDKTMQSFFCDSMFIQVCT